MKDGEKIIISWDEGWEFIQKGIVKLLRIVEGLPEPPFNSEDGMSLYTAVFRLCNQKPPHDYARELYHKYRETLEDYINSTVLPSLREEHDESMLREFVKRWANHKFMVKQLCFFLNYLDRYFIPRLSLPSLNEVGFDCFRELVYQELYPKVTNAVIAQIDREREGQQVDRVLLKSVMDIFLEFGLERYQHDFEDPILEATSAYYSSKASAWAQEGYTREIDECLEQEKDRANCYLHSTTVPKLVEKLLSVYKGGTWVYQKWLGES